MNRRQLQRLGIPPRCAAAAIDALRAAASSERGFGLKGKRARDLVRSVASDPPSFKSDAIWGKLARDLIGALEPEEEVRDPIGLDT